MKSRLVFTIIALLAIFILSACNPVLNKPATTPDVTAASFTANPTIAGEIEATEFMGTELTPIAYQATRGLDGIQHIDKTTYFLTIDGLVDNPLKLTYEDLLALPQISKLMPLNCVEGWNFIAKWTGPSLKDLLTDAKVQTKGKIAIFYSTDAPSGYSSLELSYINEKNIILGMKDNDITLPDMRGFPFQVVAESKYGYKWAKWITRIELSDNTKFRGYWESGGYNNNADVGGPAFETSP
jgi:DMSO/TMAO reductase YedYZ molybdopterin-dependent catalytic subunit